MLRTTVSTPRVWIWALRPRIWIHSTETNWWLSSVILLKMCPFCGPAVICKFFYGITFKGNKLSPIIPILWCVCHTESIRCWKQLARWANGLKWPKCWSADLGGKVTFVSSPLPGGGKHAKLHVRKCKYGIICFFRIIFLLCNWVLLQVER